MTFVLEGVQFREPKDQFPSWDGDNYRDWEDCNGRVDYPTGTEFRLPPRFDFVVTDSFDKTVLKTENKTEAMARVSNMISDENFAAIRREQFAQITVAQFLAKKDIQLKQKGQNRWQSATHFSGVTSSPTRFRFRPDDYFQVDVKTGIAQSTLDFDDVDELEKYVSRMLRTSNNSIHVTRRPYGITLSL